MQMTDEITASFYKLILSCHVWHQNNLDRYQAKMRNIVARGRLQICKKAKKMFLNTSIVNT